MSDQISDLIKQHFPFENFNPGQEEAIYKAVVALREGIKHVIIAAPTGIGKSVIATTVHRVLNSLQKTHRTTIITATKSLQDQYVSGDKEIFDLRGKKNYQCPKGVGPYGSAKCSLKVMLGECKKKVECPYVKQRDEWCNVAPLRLTNNSFQIEACPALVMQPENKADLIVIDECHELPKHLITHNTIELNIRDFFYCRKIFGDAFVGYIIDFIDTFMDMTVGAAFKPTSSQKTEMETLVERFSDAASLLEEMLEEKDRSKRKYNIETLSGAQEELQNITDKLKLYVSLVSGEWILTEYVRNEKVDLKPVYAFQVSNYGLFRKAEQFIHMSATICGFETYRECLGISESYVEIDVDNPIPKANRRVMILGNLYVSKEFDRTKLSTYIDKIINFHGHQNGVIHTVSFKLAEEIKKLSSNSDRMVVSNDRKEILRLLGDYNSGAIILSPSIETGIDLKGDLARWQIIAKVPFGNLSDKWIRLNMERSSSWYSREAILRCVQASGRVCRGVDDKGVTYIIDSNIKRLIKEHHNLFPDWYLESLVVK